MKGLTPAQHADIEAGYAEAEAAIKRATGPDWQAGRHELRDPEAEVVTPSLDEMAKNPGATQTQYRVAYERVGRHGGRNGSKPPAPLTVWAVGLEGLSDHIAKDIRPYIASSDAEFEIDDESMTGRIYAGFRNAGSFTVEVLQVAEGEVSRG